jgi:hypothetical protein
MKETVDRRNRGAAGGFVNAMGPVRHPMPRSLAAAASICYRFEPSEIAGAVDDPDHLHAVLHYR